MTFPFSFWTTSGGIVAGGGTKTHVGGFTVHRFTSSGTFHITSGSGTVYSVIVAGGGGGGSGFGFSPSGGGGGGGILQQSTTLGVASYAVDRKSIRLNSSH